MFYCVCEPVEGSKPGRHFSFCCPPDRYSQWCILMCALQQKTNRVGILEEGASVPKFYICGHLTNILHKVILWG